MKKLTLLVLLAFPATAFAQNNEIQFSTGLTHYSGQHSSFHGSHHADYASGSGYQASLYYLRNFKWLQIGGGLEFGILSTQTFAFTRQDQSILVNITEQHKPAGPYFAPNIQASFVLPLKQWSFYAGPSAGYMVSTAHDKITYTVHAQDMQMIEGTYYETAGFYAGAQGGIMYKLPSGWYLSADLMARVTKLEVRSGPDRFLPPRTDYDRLNIYNFGLGVRYRF